MRYRVFTSEQAALVERRIEDILNTPAYQIGHVPHEFIESSNVYRGFGVLDIREQDALNPVFYHAQIMYTVTEAGGWVPASSLVYVVPLIPGTVLKQGLALGLEIGRRKWESEIAGVAYHIDPDYGVSVYVVWPAESTIINNYVTNTYVTNNQIVNNTVVNNTSITNILGCLIECPRERPPCPSPCYNCDDTSITSRYVLRLDVSNNLLYIRGTTDLDYVGDCVWSYTSANYTAVLDRLSLGFRLAVYDADDNELALYLTSESDCCVYQTLTLIHSTAVGFPPIVTIEPVDECLPCVPPPLDCYDYRCVECNEAPSAYTTYISRFSQPYDGFNGFWRLVYVSVCLWEYTSGDYRVNYDRSTGYIKGFKNIGGWNEVFSHYVDPVIFTNCCANLTGVISNSISDTYPASIILSPEGECIKCDAVVPDPCASNLCISQTCAGCDPKYPIARYHDVTLSGYRNTNPVGINVEELNRTYRLAFTADPTIIGRCGWRYEDNIWLIVLWRQASNPTGLDCGALQRFVYYYANITHKPTNIIVTDGSYAYPMTPQSGPVDCCLDIPMVMRTLGRLTPGISHNANSFTTTFVPIDCVVCQNPPPPPPDPCAWFNSQEYIPIHIVSDCPCLNNQDIILIKNPGPPVTFDIDLGDVCDTGDHIKISLYCENGVIKVSSSGIPPACDGAWYECGSNSVCNGHTVISWGVQPIACSTWNTCSILEATTYSTTCPCLDNNRRDLARVGSTDVWEASKSSGCATEAETVMVRCVNGVIQGRIVNPIDDSGWVDGTILVNTPLTIRFLLTVSALCGVGSHSITLDVKSKVCDDILPGGDGSLCLGNECFNLTLLDGPLAGSDLPLSRSLIPCYLTNLDRVGGQECIDYPGHYVLWHAGIVWKLSYGYLTGQGTIVVTQDVIFTGSRPDLIAVIDLPTVGCYESLPRHRVVLTQKPFDDCRLFAPV